MEYEDVIEAVEVELDRGRNRRPAVAAEVNISIVNFRTPDMTIQAVETALQELGGFSARVTIVDNGSGDGSADRIGSWVDALPEAAPVSLIRSSRNLGFAGGHNLGLRACAAPFHMLLNSDTLLREGALHALLETARRDDRLGVVAPRLEDEDGTAQISCFRQQSAMSELIRGAETAPITRVLSSFDVPLSFDPNPTNIGWVSFACVLLRSEMIAEVGPLDDGFFLYFDDVEYCLRATRAGWRIAYEPAARVVHFRGGSGPVKQLAKAKQRLPTYYYASRTRYFRRRHGRLGPLAANVAWLLGRGIAWTRPLLGRRPLPANAREALDIWTNFLNPLDGPHVPKKS